MFKEPPLLFINNHINQEHSNLNPNSQLPHQNSKRTGSYLKLNQLSLKNNRLKFETRKYLPIILEESI